MLTPLGIYKGAYILTVDDYVEMFSKYRPNKLLGEGVQAQFFVETYLSDKDRTVTELSNLLDVSTARMAVIINSLEKSGKVIRNKCDLDKRLTYVHLTEEGQKDIDGANSFLRSKIEIAIKALGEEEFERFAKDLMILVNLRGNDLC